MQNARASNPRALVTRIYRPIYVRAAVAIALIVIGAIRETSVLPIVRLNDAVNKPNDVPQNGAKSFCIGARALSRE